VRVPSGEPELVRAGAAGDPAALAALWDAYGARVFAFSQRVLGRADAAADAAQDAFLLAAAQLGSLARAGESFGNAVFRAARTTSYDLLARDRATGGGRPAAGASLSAAAARLRPQQRAALALSGLEGLRYAEIAAVLGIGTEAVGALLARARLRLHDELHGTALAAAAVRSPDCEDVLALLAAASDGELAAADAAWADPHVESCPTCPRTRRAMDEAAATYAAWSPAVPPSWLREATLAELGAEAPTAAPAAAAGPVAFAGRGGGAAAAGSSAASRRAGATWTAPRPRLTAALLGACLLAFRVRRPGADRERVPAPARPAVRRGPAARRGKEPARGGRARDAVAAPGRRAEEALAAPGATDPPAPGRLRARPRGASRLVRLAAERDAGRHGHRAAAAGRATEAQAREPAAARDAGARPRRAGARSCRSRAGHRRRPRRRASRRELHVRRRAHDGGAGSRGGDDHRAGGAATLDPGGAAGGERPRPRWRLRERPG
jgi:DNA-directed RNA polymerase specialized sigma24 family protein